jgi:hypothetical protein
MNALACGKVLAFVFVILAMGCQDNSALVSGTVTLDGRQLSIPSDGRGTIVFQPTNGQGTAATAVLDPSGHFKLATGASLDIPPGKYYVAVSVVQLLPRAEGAEQSAKRISPAKYASASESGLQAEIVRGDNHFDFNLASSADETAADGSGATPSPPEPSGSVPRQGAIENN